MAHQRKDDILDILKFASSIFPALCVLEKNVRYVLSIVRELEGGINPAKIVRQMSRQELKKKLVSCKSTLRNFGGAQKKAAMIKISIVYYRNINFCVLYA